MSEFKTIAEPAAVICPKSLPISRAYECEFTLNIGVFFDGTDNNRHTEPSKFTNTNIVRLWEAYKDDNDEGFFKHYVSGVGTPFTEIGEESIPGMGAPFGAGGETRIVYGLLQVINSVYRFINRRSGPRLHHLAARPHARAWAALRRAELRAHAWAVRHRVFRRADRRGRQPRPPRLGRRA